MTNSARYITVHLKLVEDAVAKRQERSLMLACALIYTRPSGNFKWDSVEESVCELLRLKPRTAANWLQYALRDGYVTKTSKPGIYNVRSITTLPGQRRRKVRYHVILGPKGFSDIKSSYLCQRIASIQSDNYTKLVKRIGHLLPASKWRFSQQPALFAMAARTEMKQNFDLASGETFLPSNVSLSLIASMLGKTKRTARIWKQRAAANDFLFFRHAIKVYNFNTEAEAERELLLYRAKFSKQAFRFTRVGTQVQIQCTDNIYVTHPTLLAEEQNLEYAYHNLADSFFYAQ